MYMDTTTDHFTPLALRVRGNYEQPYLMLSAMCNHLQVVLPEQLTSFMNLSIKLHEPPHKQFAKYSLQPTASACGISFEQVIIRLL